MKKILLLSSFFILHSALEAAVINPPLSGGGPQFSLTGFSTVRSTNSTYNTNAFIMTGFSVAGLNKTNFWNASLGLYTNASGYRTYFDPDGWWAMTNSTGDAQIISLRPDDATYSYPFYFPVLWDDVGAGGAMGTGRWASSNWVQYALKHNAGRSNQPSQFPSGILASNLNIGSQNIVTNVSPLSGANGDMLGASAIGYQNFVEADQAMIAGGGQNRISQRQGFIGGGNSSWLDTRVGASADSAFIGSEIGYMNADASAMAGTLNSTNRAFRNTFIGGSWTSLLHGTGGSSSSGIGSAMVGVYETSAYIGQGALISGRRSTIYAGGTGDNVTSLGGDNSISNLWNSFIIGGKNVANTNAQQVGILGFGITASASNTLYLGYSNNPVTIDDLGRIGPKGVLLKTNTAASVPTGPVVGGNSFFWNSNGVVYLLTSLPSTATWAATNKIAP